MLNAYYCLSDNTRDRGNPLFWPFQCLFWPQRRGLRGQANNSPTNRKQGTKQNLVPKFSLIELYRRFPSCTGYFPVPPCFLFLYIPYLVLLRVTGDTSWTKGSNTDNPFVTGLTDRQRHPHFHFSSVSVPIKLHLKSRRQQFSLTISDCQKLCSIFKKSVTYFLKKNNILCLLLLSVHLQIVIYDK